MTLIEAKVKLAQDLANVINESRIPIPVVKVVLSDMLDAIVRDENAQLEAQYQKALESEKESNDV